MKAIANLASVISLWFAELKAIVQMRGVFVLTLHPHVSGRPGLMDYVEQFVQTATEIKGIWWTTPEEIARRIIESEYATAGFSKIPLPRLPSRVKLF